MKSYTLGFVFTQHQHATDVSPGAGFTPQFDQVLLVHKNRPEWQAGRLNGLGGKLEPGETPVDCVAREIWEESGLTIPVSDWTEIGAMRGEGWEVLVFAAVYSGDSVDATAQTDEQIGWYPIQQLPKETLPNLRWLIPLCLHKFQGDDVFSIASIEYARPSRG